jgi:hypothetical protein
MYESDEHSQNDKKYLKKICIFNSLANVLFPIYFRLLHHMLIHLNSPLAHILPFVFKTLMLFVFLLQTLQLLLLMFLFAPDFIYYHRNNLEQAFGFYF